MATAFGHAIIAYTFKYPFCNFKKNKKMTYACVISSIFPDIDILAFNFGIPYAHMFGHRGFSRSLLFALIYSLLIILLFFRGEKNLQRLLGGFLIFISMISHGILDAFTNGGLGVGFFIPFNDKRYFFSERFIEVSPIGRNFFSMRGLDTLANEAIVILLPAVLVLISFYFLKKVRNKTN
jgi:inner membrane protein